MFIVNKHATNSYSITGWENWNVVKWGQLKADNFTSENPIGNHNPLQPWSLETVKTNEVTHVKGTAINIPKISVNHIEISESFVIQPIPSTPVAIPPAVPITQIFPLTLTMTGADGAKYKVTFERG